MKHPPDSSENVPATLSTFVGKTGAVGGLTTSLNQLLGQSDVIIVQQVTTLIVKTNFLKDDDKGLLINLESADLTETINAMPIPARKRKENAATKQTKPNAAGKLNSKASKQLANIMENPESDEEPLVLKKGHGSRKKTLMIVEDLENSDRDLPPTKKSRFSDGTKQEVKSTQWGKKESIREAISAIHQGQKAATTDMNNSGMGDSEVVMKEKGKVQVVTE